MARSGLAWTYLYVGDYEAGRRSFRLALPARQRLRDTGGLARTLYGLGWTELLLERPETALETFRGALDLRAPCGSPLEMRADRATGIRQPAAADAVGAVARKLARLILPEGVASRLARRVVVVASGAPQLVPFGLLPVTSDSRPPILLEGHEVVSLPSASVISLIRRRTTAVSSGSRKTLAIFADPVFDAGGRAGPAWCAVGWHGHAPGFHGGARPCPG